MIDSLSLGCGPSDEDCAQVGSEGYRDRAWKECNAFREQLRRTFGEEPTGAKLLIKSSPHDFGSYLEVECSYNESEASVKYAFECEGRGPAYWDKEACEALGLKWEAVDRRQ